MQPQTPSGGIVFKKQPPKPIAKPTPRPYTVPKVPLVLVPPTTTDTRPASPLSTSINLQTRPFKKPRLLWKTFIGPCEATATATPEGVAICSGDQIQLLDRNGHTIWARETGATRATATLKGNHLYLGTEAGMVYAIERKGGKVLWKAPVAQGQIRQAPLVIDNKVIVESFDNTIYAIEIGTGNLIWKYERKEGSFGYAAPVLTRTNISSTQRDDMILLVCGDSYLYALDPSTGNERWRTSLNGKSVTTPAVLGDKLFLSGDGIVPIALSPQKGRRLWEASGIKTGWFGACLLAGNTLYVTNDQRYVYAINSNNGQMRWQVRLLGGSQNRPTLEKETNTLYIGSITFRDNPTLTALEATTGAKLWEYKAGYLSASPLIENGVLYIGSTNGNFYAFGLH
jgi:eukaryotic-like serine/threonine-protein kinase